MATAHKLARIIHGMIKSGQPYDEGTAFKVTPASQGKRIQYLQKQAASRGFQLVPAAEHDGMLLRRPQNLHRHSFPLACCSRNATLWNIGWQNPPPRCSYRWARNMTL